MLLQAGQQMLVATELEGSYVIAARMHTKLGSHSNGCAEQEYDIEQVDDHRDYRMTSERFIEGNQQEVDQR